MKFLPPEEEIRAQLRELTSQTRRLRADLQGMITRRGPKSFSHDKRYRLKPERPSSAPAETAPEAEPKEQHSEALKSVPRSAAKKRRR